MKKPWQIWTLYAICLLVAVPAMLWLSLQSLQLERARENDRVQTELARREAELQERVSSALWRMDGFLTNLIAREATRPWYFYQSFYDVAAFPSAAEQQQAAGQSLQQAVTSPPRQVRYRLASPLLVQPSEFVRLHFQIDSDNVVTSPQTPQGPDRWRARQRGLSDAALQDNQKLIDEVQVVCDFSSLLTSCSPELLPASSGDPLRLQKSAPDGIATNSRQGDLRSGAAVSLVESAGAGGEDFSFFQELQKSLPAESRILPEAGGPALPAGGKVPQALPTQKQLVQQNRNLSRGDREYSQRQMNANAYAMSEWMGNEIVEPPVSEDAVAVRVVREGVMQPLWIGKRLILARRVLKDQQQVIQGCWLDWPGIRRRLEGLVSDLLPEVEFRSVTDPDQVILGQALATLPVQLVIDRPRMIERLTLDAGSQDESVDATSDPPGIMRRSLWIAWTGLAFAAVAGAFLLQGVLRLSERRAAFVSAVSHELRTPLTTFRMYAEMMAGNMVPRERQPHYAETLKREAERLSHLVENVLQFARLERSSQQTRYQQIRLGDALKRFQDRLEDRVEQAGMQLVTELPDEVVDQTLETDPAAIEQILFNLVDNACKYARDAEDRRIVLSGSLQPAGRLQLAVRDFGPGVSPQDRKRMFQPFRKSDIQAANSAHGVGLGLALCLRMARSLGGQLRLAECQDGRPGAKLVLEIPCSK
jgi:signal transduction histidine kinase